LAFTGLAGLILTVIGIRFLFWPEAAARFFGVGAHPAGTEMHAVVALRDLWLGLMLLALAACRQWQAMAIWFGLGALVCFGDAALVANTTAKAQGVAFHVVSGIACVAIALACRARR